MTFEAYDKYGNKLPPGTTVVPDGGSIREVAMLMDAPPPALSRPGQATISRSDRNSREAAYQQRKRNLSDAWRNPPPLLQADSPKPPSTAVATGAAPLSDANARYAARCAQLESAWKGDK